MADGGKNSIVLRKKEECKWDLVSLGEVMLRLDPGDVRVADEFIKSRLDMFLRPLACLSNIMDHRKSEWECWHLCISVKHKFCFGLRMVSIRDCGRHKQRPLKFVF